MARGRGTRRSGSLKGGRSKIARRRGRAVALNHRLGGIGAFRSGTTTPYGPGTPSIKRKDVYRALRRQGASKSKAARIANATANGTIDRRRKGGGRKGPRIKRR